MNERSQHHLSRAKITSLLSEKCGFNPVPAPAPALPEAVMFSLSLTLLT